MPHFLPHQGCRRWTLCSLQLFHFWRQSKGNGISWKCKFCTLTVPYTVIAGFNMSWRMTTALISLFDFKAPFRTVGASLERDDNNSMSCVPSEKRTSMHTSALSPVAHPTFRKVGRPSTSDLTSENICDNHNLLSNTIKKWDWLPVCRQLYPTYKSLHGNIFPISRITEAARRPLHIPPRMPRGILIVNEP